MENDFGKYLRRIRLESGFSSQRQLAEASGVSNGTIARLENNSQQPKPDTLKLLAVVLNETTYEDLLENAGYFDIDGLEKRAAELNNKIKEAKSIQYFFKNEEKQTISKEAEELMKVYENLPEDEKAELHEKLMSYAKFLKSQGEL